MNLKWRKEWACMDGKCIPCMIQLWNGNFRTQHILCSGWHIFKKPKKKDAKTEQKLTEYKYNARKLFEVAAAKASVHKFWNRTWINAKDRRWRCKRALLLPQPEHRIYNNIFRIIFGWLKETRLIWNVEYTNSHVICVYLHILNTLRLASSERTNDMSNEFSQGGKLTKQEHCRQFRSNHNFVPSMFNAEWL